MILIGGMKKRKSERIKKTKFDGILEEESEDEWEESEEENKSILRVKDVKHVVEKG